MFQLDALVPLRAKYTLDCTRAFVDFACATLYIMCVLCMDMFVHVSLRLGLIWMGLSCFCTSSNIFLVQINFRKLHLADLHVQTYMCVQHTVARMYSTANVVVYICICVHLRCGQLLCACQQCCRCDYTFIPSPTETSLFLAWKCTYKAIYSYSFIAMFTIFMVITLMNFS